MAAKDENGKWRIWTLPQFESALIPIRSLVENLIDPIDLSFYADDDEARLGWIGGRVQGSSISEKGLSNITIDQTNKKTENAEIKSPSSQVDQRVDEIESKFRERYNSEVLKPHQAAVTKLNIQFAAALRREEQTATKAGNLEAVLAWENRR